MDTAEHKELLIALAKLEGKMDAMHDRLGTFEKEQKERMHELEIVQKGLVAQMNRGRGALALLVTMGAVLASLGALMAWVVSQATVVKSWLQ